VDYPDPQDWLPIAMNLGNPQVDQLLAQADVERDQHTRFSLYHQAEELAVDDVALIPYAQGKNIVVFQKDVHGYALLPNGLTSPDLWANVYICAGPC
jgi:oligopeptide transport system substrate-binding protein